MARNPLFALLWLVLLFCLAWPVAGACCAVGQLLDIVWYSTHRLCLARGPWAFRRSDGDWVLDIYRLSIPFSQIFASLSFYLFWFDSDLVVPSGEIIIYDEQNLAFHFIASLRHSHAQLYSDFLLSFYHMNMNHSLLKDASVSSRILLTSWRKLSLGPVMLVAPLVIAQLGAPPLSS